MTNCPACGGALQRHEHGYVLFGCTGCGGVLADPATSKMVFDGMRKHLLAAAAKNIEEDAIRSAPAEAPRKCPSCQTSMNMRTWHGVNVDICDAHGVWFDRGELAAVAMRLKSGERAELTMPSGSSAHVPSWSRLGGSAAAGSAVGGGIGIGDGAADAVGFGIDILSDLLD